MLEICEKCSKILDIFAFQLRSLDFEFSEDLFFQIKRAQKEAMIFLQIQSIKFTKKNPYTHRPDGTYRNSCDLSTQYLAKMFIAAMTAFYYRFFGASIYL